MDPLRSALATKGTLDGSKCDEDECRRLEGLNLQHVYESMLIQKVCSMINMTNERDIVWNVKADDGLRSPRSRPQLPRCLAGCSVDDEALCSAAVPVTAVTGTASVHQTMCASILQHAE